MTFCLEKARRAWIRLPRPLHAALLELRAEHPRPVVFGTSQFVRFERLLTDWKLADIKPGPFGINGEIVTGATLNRLGAAFARHLQPLSNDKRTLPPLMPLADVLADLPPAILDWLSGTPPIEKHAGGILFEALGVLLPTRRGDAYNPSRELMLALEELDFRRNGGALRQDGPASPLLSPGVAEALRRCLAPGGVPWKNDGIDGRLIRSVGTTDGAGLIALREIDGEQRWIVPHMMRPVAQALADGETDPFKLTILTPRAYQEWISDHLPLNMVPEYPRLLALIGVIKRKGKYDWKLTHDGDAIQGRVTAFLNAYDSGSPAVADLTAYDGDGVDITLPDEDGPADEDWASLDFTPSTIIIEAPVPSNAAQGFHPPLPYEPQTLEDASAAEAWSTGPQFTVWRDGGPQGPITRVEYSDWHYKQLELSAADEFAVLDMSPTPEIVEAPVPSNAELAAMRERRQERTLEHRDDYLDSVRPDDAFDIL